MVRRQAEKLKLVGWVLQHDNGQLEVVANGEERHVRVLFNWCERGPLANLVTTVETSPQPREAFFDFSVRQPPPSPDSPAETPED